MRAQLHQLLTSPHSISQRVICSASQLQFPQPSNAYISLPFSIPQQIKTTRDDMSRRKQENPQPRKRLVNGESDPHVLCSHVFITQHYLDVCLLCVVCERVSQSVFHSTQCELRECSPVTPIPLPGRPLVVRLTARPLSWFGRRIHNTMYLFE